MSGERAWNSSQEVEGAGSGFKSSVSVTEQVSDLSEFSFLFGKEDTMHLLVERMPIILLLSKPRPRSDLPKVHSTQTGWQWGRRPGFKSRSLRPQNRHFCVGEVGAVPVSGVSCLDAFDSVTGIKGGSGCLVNCKEFYGCKTFPPLQLLGHGAPQSSWPVGSWNDL